MTIKVGDKVTFNINGKQFFDVVTYINGNTIEGEKYDLTNQKLKLLN